MGLNRDEVLEQLFLFSMQEVSMFESEGSTHAESPYAYTASYAGIAVIAYMH